MKERLHTVSSLLFKASLLAMTLTLVYIVSRVLMAPTGEVAATARLGLAMLRQVLVTLTVTVGGVGALEYTIRRSEKTDSTKN